MSQHRNNVIENPTTGKYEPVATDAKLASIDTRLDILSGAGNNNIGEGTTKLQVYNYGRDVSSQLTPQTLM